MIDLLQSTTNPDEEKLFQSLRASAWDEFEGQETVREVLRVAIAAACERGEPLDHVLLYGPPGLGKTTLAFLIAQEMGVGIRVANGTTLTKPAELTALLTNLQPREVLFIDEVHRLSRSLAEMLYTAMEDRALDIVLGQGPAARVVRLDLAPFTLVGATTRYGSLVGPFRDRFGLIQRLDYYDQSALTQILFRAANKLGQELTPTVAQALAARSRGTPRVALRLLKRVRDVTQLAGSTTIHPEHLEKTLALQQVDDEGLDPLDRRYLELLEFNFAGGPVGLQTMSAALQEDAITLEEIVEPYLLQLGKIQRTPRGRVLTLKHA